MKGNKRSRRTWPTAVDLFAGSGSATAALRAAHFRIVAAVDNDPAACATYRLNHPRVHLYQTDIRDLCPSVIRDECLEDASLDLMVICAPCQPFSSQNRKKQRDERTRLLVSAAEFVAVLEPKLVFIENVPGLASSANAGLLREFREICGDQYVFGEPVCVNAADYGVPQRRLRCLLMGSRGRAVPCLPPAITPERKRRTVRDTIYGLPSLASGESDPDDPLHAARSHRQIARDRLKAISKNGGSRSELPDHLVLNCHRNHKRPSLMFTDG